MSKFDFTGAADIKGMRSLCVRTVVKSIVLAYAFTFIVFAVFAAVITYTGFSESYIDTVVVITTALSIIISGMAVSRKARTRGWLNGGIGGLVYMLILIVLGAICLKEPVLDKNTALMLLSGFLFGAVGGILGINMKRK